MRALQKPLAAVLFLGPALPFFASCSSGGGDSDSALFVLRDTSTAVAAGTQVRVSGRYVAYLADEFTSGGQNLNGDADNVDSVATVVDVVAREEINVGIAALEMAWVGTNLFLAVDEEADGFDWNGDGVPQVAGNGSTVLIHWSPETRVATHVANLDERGDPHLVSTGQRLFFAENRPGAPGAGNTSLGAIEGSAPTLPLPVTTTSGAAGGLRPILLGEDEGLVFALLDEVHDDADLNGDGDRMDGAVLALLDGSVAAQELHNTGMGVKGADVPFRANAVGASDWVVAFLVNEEAHVNQTVEPGGGTFTGFNDPSLFIPTWQPPQCIPLEDEDTDDDVLHWLSFAGWVANPGTSPIVNTGLVGRNRVLAVDGFVGTVSREEDDGGCDLNQDMDSEDRIPRWVAASDPTAPPAPPWDQDSQLIALARPAAIAGETRGLAELQNRFVMLVDEDEDGTDYDGTPAVDHRLLGWLDPAEGGSAEWTFDHGLSVPFFGGATWMAETPTRSRLLTAAPESVVGQSLNTISGDTDIADSVPTFNFIDGTPRLVFPFAAYAVREDNPGMVLSGNVGFFRVSEDADSRDWNGDGDQTDDVLVRVDVVSGVVSYMAPVASIGRPVVEVELETGIPQAGAMIARESFEARDINGDGDQTDFVLRYFRM